ncbi:MAG: SAM-dependent chlorinase/fluorinase [Bacteroidales bacterium]|nr:SAM-dependent chlorinase/fluorinase [Bacteroidales bacterium]
MAIITLTTDWGDTDYYVAAAKGRIFSEMPDAVVVDVTHKIRPFDSTEAAYVLKHAYHHFPKGTIHLIGVNTEETDRVSHVAVLYDGHYFIGADDGIFSLIFKQKHEKAVTLETPHEGDAHTFSTRDRFVGAALMLAKGSGLEELGRSEVVLVQKLPFEPASNQQGIRGMVIHIDSYENLITNIPRALFEEVIGNKPFRVAIKGYESFELSEGYSDVPDSEILCLFGSNNLLQIALNRANAASLLGIRLNDSVSVLLREADERPKLKLSSSSGFGANFL